MCGVADLYIVDFGGGEQERARGEPERDAERRRLADRYARYLAASAEMGQAAAHKVITAAELSAVHQREENAIAACLADQPGLDARRTSSYAPEQWEGTVDGHTFYFRERGGLWRIELDMVPSGRYAQRLVRVGEDGTFVTEPVPIIEGEAIARGAESDLGAEPVDHIAFVVRTIRDHLRGVGCEHHGARLFCPDCGQRMGKGS